jgi:tRNA(Ile)-lysidine synthase
MSLQQRFIDYIKKEGLFNPQDRLLLAVSGGLDSVVLTELCHRCGFDFIIVHCNFRLRGNESHRDEQFVSSLGQRYQQKAYVGYFDTQEYAAAHKVSIQVAARQLRYDWFELLVRNGKARWIVTAHHLDDNIETMLMHFFKGTGITGLRAMVPRQGNIVRPLLFAQKEELRQFAAEAGLLWVEDSSNESDKYTRNFFRHQLIPLVEQAFPAAASNLADNLHRFREAEILYRQAVEGWKKKLLETRGNEIHIPVEKLRKAEPLQTLIYEITSPFGFSPQQATAIASLLDSPTGRYVQAGLYRILRNRNWLIITPRMETQSAHVLIESADRGVPYPEGELQFTRMDATALRALDQGPNVALLDARRIGYPLLLRRWKPGDYFYPLGLPKKKKLARFLIDAKTPATEKDRVWVLECDKKIIWIVGKRIDHRWRITPATKEVLRIEFRPKNWDGSAS